MARGQGRSTFVILTMGQRTGVKECTMAVSISQSSLVSEASQVTPQELPALRALARRFPTVDAAVNEIAHLQALLHLPKGTVHIVSDVHGDNKKLQHILNNASGSLRPLVETLFGERLTADDIQRLLNIIYYPQQFFSQV